MSEEVTGNFSGGKMASVEYNGKMTMKEQYASKTNEVYDQVMKQYGSKDVKISKTDNSITMSETVKVDDSGNFKGENVYFITIGKGGIDRKTFTDKMEKDDYTCK